MNKITLNLFKFSLILVLGIGSNIAFTMGNNMMDADHKDKNTRQHCSPNTQQAGATAKTPYPDKTYNCVPIAPLKTTKNHGATTAKSPSKNNLNKSMP
jgi:hypothetical protein